MCFPNIFSLSVALFLSWIVLLVLYLKSYCQFQGHLDFSPMLYSRRFIALSFFYFELIFKKGLLSVSRFFWGGYGCPIRPAPFVEKAILSSLNFVCFFVKDQLITFVWVCFWSLCSLPLVNFSVLWLISHSLEYCCFTVSRKS